MIDLRHKKRNKKRQILIWVIVIAICACMVIPTAIYLINAAIH